MALTTILATMIAATAPAGESEAQVAPVATTPRIKRYCIDDRREDVERRPKICRTRDEWRARGFDPLLVLNR